ncbi:Adaptor protein Enigma and related PDZ-LIM proteins [Ceraceosorus bombacis]|uniref:Adaptor protein Enigma and related PDZ-LIM proteins n=1 Tax=Ceraceosorus bombacis TaxID=401625 RepID=A0A0P1BIA9_9BASI|nr:Adaptor protein Enigma and related PDZ-LIM proteins [Ceraceosorus bombacis]
MTGQFVRALGVVYHLDCFRCRDCNKVVAAKFFPATDEMGHNSGDGLERKPSPTQASGKLFPLCEVDYFRRLDLICAKCSGALRGSYITALGKKFHVEHFTCSVCPTVFGPQDSYYEHDGQVFCHFHYSSRFAIRCTGCRTAILKQFVEINRNNRDEHWHPECYMIHKFWNIKLCPTGSTPKDSAQIAAEPTTLPGVPEPSNTGVAPASSLSSSADPTPEALETEAHETPASLKHKQRLMEEQPSNTGVAPASSLSSSADPTPEALETEAHETPASLKHKQRLMEEQVYRIWTVLSAFEESSAACISDMLRNRMGITQELLSLVTGLAHYLKILIRIALTGALKLDREYDNKKAISWFLDQLAFLAREGHSNGDAGSESAKSPRSASGHGSSADHGDTAVDGRPYGYRSLPRSTSASNSEGGESATDLCVACSQTVEEDCQNRNKPQTHQNRCLWVTSRSNL